MTAIILLSGKQGSGKTTAAQAVKTWANIHDIGCKFLKFADPLYEMHDAVLKILNYRGIKTPQKDGKLLQLLGTDWGREVYGPDIWAKLTRNRVDEIIRFNEIAESSQIIVIDDCRFPNELEIFPEALKIRLCASREIRKSRADAWRDNENHPSETALDNVEDLAFDMALSTEPGLNEPQEICNKIVAWLYREKSWLTRESACRE